MVKPPTAGPSWVAAARKDSEEGSDERFVRGLRTFIDGRGTDGIYDMASICREGNKEERPRNGVKGIRQAIQNHGEAHGVQLYEHPKWKECVITNLYVETPDQDKRSRSPPPRRRGQ